MDRHPQQIFESTLRMGNELSLSDDDVAKFTNDTKCIVSIYSLPFQSYHLFRSHYFLYSSLVSQDEIRRFPFSKLHAFWFVYDNIYYFLIFYRMYQRFKRLDQDSNGVISLEEFKMIPALAANPLLTRLIAIFDTNHGLHFYVYFC